MTKIKIYDLAQDTLISREEMKKVFGGIIIVRGKPNIFTNPHIDGWNLEQGIGNIGSTVSIEEDPWHG